MTEKSSRNYVTPKICSAIKNGFCQARTQWCSLISDLFNSGYGNLNIISTNS